MLCPHGYGDVISTRLIGHADYHSVDGGDLFTGRPYGYTEEYQSYEQTGSTNVSYWSQYGSGCPKRSYNSGSPGRSYWEQYGNGCPYFNTIAAGTPITTVAKSCGTCGGSLTTTYKDTINHCTVGQGYSGAVNLNWYGHKTNPRCSMITETYHPHSGDVAFGYIYDQQICLQSSGCKQLYSLGTSAYYSCTINNGSCTTSGCVHVYTTTPIMGYATRTRTITYDKQSGLFSLGIGVPYAARNTGLYSTRKRFIEHIVSIFKILHCRYSEMLYLQCLNISTYK